MVYKIQNHKKYSNKKNGDNDSKRNKQTNKTLLLLWRKKKKARRRWKLTSVFIDLKSAQVIGVNAGELDDVIRIHVTGIPVGVDVNLPDSEVEWVTGTPPDATAKHYTSSTIPLLIILSLTFIQGHTDLSDGKK